MADTPTSSRRHRDRSDGGSGKKEGGHSRKRGTRSSRRSDSTKSTPASSPSSSGGYSNMPTCSSSEAPGVKKDPNAKVVSSGPLVESSSGKSVEDSEEVTEATEATEGEGGGGG